MQKLLLKIGLLALLYLGIFTPLSWYYDHYYQENLDLCDKADWILSLSGQSYEDGFIGSSRAYNMLDLVSYEEETGTTAINLATSGSNFAENYLLLQKFYEAGNRINQLFIQVDIYSLDARSAYSYPFHEYKYLPYLSEDSVARIIRENSDYSHYLMWKYIPFLKYMEFNYHYDFYKTLRGGFQCTESDFNDSRGSLLHEGVLTPATDAKPPQNYGFAPDDLRYLELLIRFAQTQNIRVNLYMAPEYEPYLAHQLNRKELLGRMEEVAERYQLPFFRFDQDSFSREPSYFRDNTHLNVNGTTLFTRLFVQKIAAKKRLGS